MENLNSMDAKMSVEGAAIFQKYMNGKTLPSLQIETTTLFEQTTGDGSTEGLSPVEMAERLRITFLVVAPIIVIVGIIGNSLTVAVFRRDSLRRHAASILFSTLAVSNIAVLLFGLLPKWFEYAQKKDVIRVSFPYACQVSLPFFFNSLSFFQILKI